MGCKRWQTCNSMGSPWWDRASGEDRQQRDELGHIKGNSEISNESKHRTTIDIRKQQSGPRDD